MYPSLRGFSSICVRGSTVYPAIGATSVLYVHSTRDGLRYNMQNETVLPHPHCIHNILQDGPHSNTQNEERWVK